MPATPLKGRSDTPTPPGTTPPMPTVRPTNLPHGAPTAHKVRTVVPSVPRVPAPTDTYPFTNDVFFGDSETLRPVPVLPAVPDLPHIPNPECRLNPPPTELIVTKDPPIWGTPGNVVTRTFEFVPGPIRKDIDQARLGLDEEGRASVGVGIQLAALGPQNYVLDINPQLSFFKQVYKRHTAFATECFQDDVDLRFGTMTSVEIPRRGDMLGNTYLEVTLPNLGVPGGRWADAVGYVLLSRIKFIVDDVVIHDHERLWYDLVDKAFASHGKALAIDRMIGRGETLRTDASHTLHIPFKFFFCSNHAPGRQFLPLASMHTAARIVLELTVDTLEACVHLPPGSVASLKSLRGRVLTEQVFVEQDEQRAAWQRPTHIMIETTQDIDALNYKFDDSSSHAVGAVSLDLREINLPVKSLVFVAYSENATNTKEYFKYRPIEGAVMYVNSSERFQRRRGDYFSLVQPYAHSARCSADNVHMYSFALDAGAHQPCGSLNFAVLARPSLRVELAAGDAIDKVKVKAFAQCVNWLVFQSRGLAFLFS